MIATLTAALVLLAVVVAFQGAVLTRLVRRLREVESQLAPESFLPAAGHPVGEFSARSTDGVALSRESLSGERLVVFLAAGCPSCPGLLAELRDARGGASREETLVFALGGPDDSDAVDLAAGAEPFALAAVAGYGPVPAAFGVNSFPVVMLVSDGVITRAGHSPGELSRVD